MKRKKILFVMVEGRSEETAFGVIVSRLFPQNIVHFHVMNGDITSNNKTYPSNIVSKITAEVRDFAQTYSLKKQDFQEIIHLIDTDGAFVPKSLVNFSKKHKKIYYTEDEILTFYPDQIEERNKRKTQNLHQLRQVKRIWGSIPYRVFYMSTNLEHVLMGKLNCSNREKEKCAFRFAMKYKDRLEAFINFMTDSDFARVKSFQESWDYIEEGNHSLNRNSNYGLVFKPFKEKGKES